MLIKNFWWNFLLKICATENEKKVNQQRKMCERKTWLFRLKVSRLKLKLGPHKMLVHWNMVKEFGYFSNDRSTKMEVKSFLFFLFFSILNLIEWNEITLNSVWSFIFFFLGFRQWVTELLLAVGMFQLFMKTKRIARRLMRWNFIKMSNDRFFLVFLWFALNYRLYETDSFVILM